MADTPPVDPDLLRLRWARQLRDLRGPASQNDMARALGVSRQDVLIDERGWRSCQPCGGKGVVTKPDGHYHRPGGGEKPYTVPAGGVCPRCNGSGVMIMNPTLAGLEQIEKALGVKIELVAIDPNTGERINGQGASRLRKDDK